MITWLDKDIWGITPRKTTRAAIEAATSEGHQEACMDRDGQLHVQVSEKYVRWAAGHGLTVIRMQVLPVKEG